MYRGIGAECCDLFYNSKDNYIKGLVDNLIENSLEDFQNYISESSKITVIDVGPGNAVPTKSILNILHNQNKLNRYVGIDISNEMNEIAIKNVKSWFKNVDTKAYQRDFENTHFGHIFSISKSITHKESNFVLFTGSTLNNCDDRVSIFKNISSGLLRDDLFMGTITLDHIDNRIKNDYIKNAILHRQAQWFYDLIGIDSECQENIKVIYNPALNRNEKFIQLTKDYEIVFEIGSEEIVINLFKDEKIMFWKHYLIDNEILIKELELSGLELLVFKKDPSARDALFIARLKQ